MCYVYGHISPNTLQMTRTRNMYITLVSPAPTTGWMRQESVSKKLSPLRSEGLLIPNAMLQQKVTFIVTQNNQQKNPGVTDNTLEKTLLSFRWGSDHTFWTILDARNRGGEERIGFKQNRDFNLHMRYKFVLLYHATAWLKYYTYRFNLEVILITRKEWIHKIFHLNPKSSARHNSCQY